MKLILALLLASASCCSLAEPLFQPDTRAVTGEDAKTRDNIKALPGAKSVVPIKLNRNLLFSTILEVEIDGKTYRISGKPTDTAKVGAEPGSSGWSGTGDGTLATIVVPKDGSVFGHLALDGRNFTVSGRAGKLFLSEHAPIDLSEPPKRELLLPKDPRK